MELDDASISKLMSADTIGIDLWDPVKSYTGKDGIPRWVRYVRSYLEVHSSTAKVLSFPCDPCRVSLHRVCVGEWFETLCNIRLKIDLSMNSNRNEWKEFSGLVASGDRLILRTIVKGKADLPEAEITITAKRKTGAAASAVINGYVEPVFFE